MRLFRHIALKLPVMLSAAWLAASCSGDNPAYNRENVKGTWLVDIRDAAELPERDWTVATFNSAGTVVLEGVLTQEDANFQWGNNTLMYEIYCCDFSIDGNFSGLFGFSGDAGTEQEYYFVDSRDSLMTVGIESLLIDGVEVVPEFSQITMRKLPADYAAVDTLAGVWQFNTRDGATFTDYRIQFHNDGALTVSSRTGENSWTPMGGGEDYFNRYDNLLALTLYDNAAFGTPAKWDVRCFQIDSVSIPSGRMAMRSAGSSYTLSYISSN